MSNLVERLRRKVSVTGFSPEDRLAVTMLDNLFNEAADTIEQQQAEIERLRSKYAEAIEDIGDWGAYAGDYFQSRHDLEGCIAGHRAALAQEG